MLRLAPGFLAAVMACSTYQTPPAPPTPATPLPMLEVERVAPVPVPAPPVVVQPQPAWRMKLADSEHLSTITHPAFAVQDGFQQMMALLETSDRELAALIDQLPDDSGDLPEAVCILSSHSHDRRDLETQLRRGIAAVRARANGDVGKLYGSMRASYLAVEVGARVKDGKLVREPRDALLGGAASYSCDTPDVGRLGYQLAELYLGEERYPKDPFTGEVDAGPFSSKRGKASAGLAELDAMYREVTKLAPADPALATLLDIASIECTSAKTVFSVCTTRAKVVARVLAIREAGLPAGDPAVADTRIVQARRLLDAKKPTEAEALLRRVLAETQKGVEARLHATLDLATLLRSRRDVAGAQKLEVTLLEDLVMPAGTRAYEWSTIGELFADVAEAEGRNADAAVILTTLDKSLTPGNPLCVDDESCDNRWTRAHLFDRLATLEPAATTAHMQHAAELRRQIDAIRIRKVDEVKARMAGSP